MTSTWRPRPHAPLAILLLSLGLAAPSGMAARGAPATAPTGVPEATPSGTVALRVSRTVALENDRVRAHAIEYPPGARTPEHEHTVPRVVVVLAGGTLEMHDAAGGMKTLVLKSGDVVYRPPEKHSVANVGATTLRLVEVDVLDCPRP